MPLSFHSLESRSFAEIVQSEGLLSWMSDNYCEVEGIIISPDTDGFVSGLFLNEVFGWKVVGLYDGKSLVLTKELDFPANITKYAFIDVEILRPNVKSIGHHMLLWDKRHVPDLIDSIIHVCAQPNLWRNYDASRDFSKKYPFGTFHFLLSIIHVLHPSCKALDFDPKDAVAPTIYIDGVFKNLFNYPENCLDWLKYLTGGNEDHPLEKILNNKNSLKGTMSMLGAFFKSLEKMWGGTSKTKGGKIQPIDAHLGKEQGGLSLNDCTAHSLEKYLEYLSTQYGWKSFDKRQKLWPVIRNELQLFSFKKGIYPTGKRKYMEVVNKKPISLAITSRSRKGLEFTEDIDNVFTATCQRNL